MFLENSIFKVPSKNDQHSFQPVYYFSRFVGLWPFTIVYNSNGSIKEARVQLFDGLWLLVSIGLYLTALFYTCDDLKNAKPPNEFVYFAELLFYICQIPPILFGPVCIVLDMFNRDNLINILEKFIIFDNQISKFGISFNYKSEMRHACLYLMIPTLMAIPLLLMTIVEYNPDWETSTTFLRWSGPQLLRSFLCISVSMSFAIFIRNLYLRFAGINSLLRNQFLTSNRLKLPSRLYFKDLIDIIKFIGRQHAFLIDILDQLNVSYAFQIFITTAATFMHAILTMYDFCHVGSVSILLSFIQSAWFVLNMSFTLAIIYYSSLLTNEGKRTIRIVHDIVNCCHDSDMIQSMIAAIATYLIIVLNFESTSTKNN